MPESNQMFGKSSGDTADFLVLLANLFGSVTWLFENPLQLCEKYSFMKLVALLIFETDYLI